MKSSERSVCVGTESLQYQLNIYTLGGWSSVQEQINVILIFVLKY